MSKIQCFACEEFGYYSSQFPTRKKGNKGKKKKQMAATTTEGKDEFTTKFDDEFSLIVLLGCVTSHGQYIDSRENAT